MAFSGSSVVLGDLDDFISPSQECVKPLIEAAEGGGSAKLSGASDMGAAPRVLEVPQVQRPNLIKSKQSADDPKAEIGQVSLSDCLACSGCVTSAETVLLQEQSGGEFLRRAAASPLTVVSISAEARASLSAHLGTPPLLAMRRVATLLGRHGVAHVLETSAAEAMALLEGKAEFMRRFAEVAQAGARTLEKPPLPLLTSHCPGWTCYAEKVVDPVVLPHLAPLKSPQQVQGRLVKTCLLEEHNRRRLHRWWRTRSPLFMAECWWWSRTALAGDGAVTALAPSDVYHVSVQPCFDRKIEAVRPGFNGLCEVDTVLTTTELLDLIVNSAGGVVPEVPAGTAAADVLEALPPCPQGSEVLTDLFLGDIFSGRPQPLLCAVRGNAGSGGFIEHVFQEAARELFQIEVNSPLEFKTMQNEDMREVSLRRNGTGEVLLRFVAAYGFRNIQNVVRHITKAGKDAAQQRYDFVEVMACPGGCLNGGGQVPAPRRGAGREQASQSQSDRRDHLGRLEDALVHGDGTAVLPAVEHPLVLPLYRYIAANSGGHPADGAGSDTGGGRQPSLKDLVGAAAVKSWLSAEWRSLKVDSDGKPVVGTSALKW